MSGQCLVLGNGILVGETHEVVLVNVQLKVDLACSGSGDTELKRIISTRIHNNSKDIRDFHVLCGRQIVW